MNQPQREAVAILDFGSQYSQLIARRVREANASDVELYQTLQTVGSGGTTNHESVALDAKLTDVFGEAGKLSLQDVIRLHTQQLEEAQVRHRSDLAAHQMIYLDQIRSCKEEIHQLKVALRQQQSHNQRLQQMLRGGI